MAGESLAELMKQVGYYQAGGGKESTLDKINKTFGSISNLGTTIGKIADERLAARQAQLKAEEEALQRKTLGERFPAPSTTAGTESITGEPVQTAKQPTWEEHYGLPTVAKGLRPSEAKDLGITMKPQKATTKVVDALDIELAPILSAYEGKELPVSQIMQAQIDQRVRLSQQGATERQKTGLSESERKNVRKIKLDAQQKLRTDSVIKQLNEQRSSLSQIEQILNTGDNKLIGSNIGALQAKMIEGASRLTDKDVIRYVNSNQLGRKAADTLTNWIKGKPSKATIEDIRQIANVLDSSYKERLAPVLESHAKELSYSLGIPLTEAYDVLGYDYDEFKTTGGGTAGTQEMIYKNGWTPEKELELKRLQQELQEGK